MGSTADKIKGHANEAAGKVKEEVGKAVGNDHLEGEGVVQTVKGQTQVGVGKAKDTVKKVVDDL